jgi:hypothetical protein
MSYRHYEIAAGLTMTNPKDVTIGQAFQYEVEKEARKREIVFEYVEGSNEQLRVEFQDGIPYIIANRAGMLALAKLLVTIGASRRLEDLNLHLRQNFDGDREEVLRIRLSEENTDSSQPTDAPDAAAA